MERVNSNSVEPEFPELAPARPKRGAASKLTEWQRFFLNRLEYMVIDRREHTGEDATQQTFRSKAIYSTYLDCQTQGVGEAASEILARQTGPSAN